MLAHTIIKPVLIAAAMAGVTAPAAALQNVSGARERITGTWQVIAFDPVPGSRCPPSGWRVEPTVSPPDEDES
jgi:hypothetical protein